MSLVALIMVLLLIYVIIHYEHGTFMIYIDTIVFLIAYYFISLFVQTIYNPFDYARITGVDFKATLIDSESSGNYVDVVETLEYDIKSFLPNNLYAELWRGMSEDQADGLTTSYVVKSVKQVLPDGTKIAYEKSPRIYTEDEHYTDPNLGPKKWYYSKGPYNEYRDAYECLMIYHEPIYKGQLKFEIEYEIHNVTFKYLDSSELYLQIFNGDETRFLKHFGAEILIPNELMPEEQNYYARAYGTFSSFIDYNVDAEKNPGFNTFYFNVDDAKEFYLKPYDNFVEFLIVSYSQDKHIFAEHAPKNRYTDTNALDDLIDERNDYEESEQFKHNIRYFVYIGCLVFSSGLVITTIYLLLRNRKQKSTNEDISLEYDYYAAAPSKFDLHFVSTLFHCKSLRKKSPIEYSFPAILLNLIHKNIISIDNEIIFILNQDAVIDNINSDGYLTPSETKVYELIKRNAVEKRISISNLYRRMELDFDYTISFLNNMDRYACDYGFTEGYFSTIDFNKAQQKLLQKGKSRVMLGLVCIPLLNMMSFPTFLSFANGGYLILGLTLIITGLILVILSKYYVQLTPKGELEYKKWHAYYKYLKNSNLYHETDLEEMPNYEECLTYAIALGLPVKKIEALKFKYPKLSNIDNRNFAYIRTYRLHGRRIHRSYHHARSRYSIHTYGGSSYSRGGRGGGGGY